MTKLLNSFALLLALTVMCAVEARAQRLMENLGRGVVAVNQGPVFTESDIKDLVSFATRLKQHADPVSEFVWRRLSEMSMQRLTNYTRGSDSLLVSLLVQDLNKAVLQGSPISAGEQSATDMLSTIRLNSALLAEAFPQALRRPQRDQVFISWRLLGTDPENIAFNLYRTTAGGSPAKLNAEPIREVTWFVDGNATLSEPNAYFVRPVLDGQEHPASAPFNLKANTPAQLFFSVPLQNPPGCTPNDVSVADLDGDGEYDFVVKQEMRPRDNGSGGLTGETRLQGYKLDGTLLWTINLGKNIREGAHYTQFMVADFDGDGKAELACKTADGTVDGKGAIIGDANANHVNPQGHIIKGPEFFTIFDGLTGAALVTTNYLPARHATKLDPTAAELRELWGDGNGNRSDRYLACVAYLDGKLPSAVMCRGYYTRATLAAWDWRDGKLSLRWFFDSDSAPESRIYRGQGNHNLSVADVDGDGRDEIIYGACTIDDDGKGLYSTRLGHGDALHVSDLDPSNPGLEVFDIQERFDDAGMNFRDAKTGLVLWRKPSVQAATAGGDAGEGPGRGCSMNLDPRHPGSECWAAGAGMTGLFNSRGERISQRGPRSCNFGIWWDGDLLRELLDRNYIAKWNWSDGSETTLLTGLGCTSNNGTKATPAVSCDLFGDWREEVVWRTTDNRELRIFTTVIPTKHRIHTLMHDPQYRAAIAWQNVAYNQPPHPSFYLDEAAPLPPRPNVVTRR